MVHQNKTMQSDLLVVLNLIILILALLVVLLSLLLLLLLYRDRISQVVRGGPVVHLGISQLIQQILRGGQEILRGCSVNTEGISKY